MHAGPDLTKESGVSYLSCECKWFLGRSSLCFVGTLSPG